MVALLIKSLWTMYKKSPKGWVAYVVMAGTFILTAFVNVSAIFVIIGCAVFGLVTSLLMKKKEEQK